MSDSDTDEYTYEDMDNGIEANSLSMATKRKLDEICRNRQQSSSHDRNDRSDHSDSDSDCDHNDNNDNNGDYDYEHNGVKIDFILDQYINLLLRKFKKFNVKQSKYSHVIEKCERLFNSFKRQKPHFLHSRSFKSLICCVGNKIAGEVDLTDIIKLHHNTFIKIMIRVLRDEPISVTNHTQTENNNAINHTININNNDNAIAVINDNNINNISIGNAERDLNNVRKRLKFDYLGSSDETASMRNGSINGDDIRSSVSSTVSEDITAEDVPKSVVAINSSSQQMYEIVTNGIKKSINMAVVSPVPVKQSVTSSSMALDSPASSTLSVMSPVSDMPLSDMPLSNEIVSPSSASMTPSVISNDSLKIKSSASEYTIYPELNKRIESEIRDFPNSFWYKTGGSTLPIFDVNRFVRQVNEEHKLHLSSKQINRLGDHIFKVIKHRVMILREEEKNKTPEVIIID